MHIQPPVFTISLLRPYQGEYRPLRPIEVEGKAGYKVEKIVQYYGNDRKWQDLVQWLHYDASEDCWLWADKLQNASVVLTEYLTSSGLTQS